MIVYTFDEVPHSHFRPGLVGCGVCRRRSFRPLSHPQEPPAFRRRHRAALRRYLGKEQDRVCLRGTDQSNLRPLVIPTPWLPALLVPEPSHRTTNELLNLARDHENTPSRARRSSQRLARTEDLPGTTRQRGTKHS